MENKELYLIVSPFGPHFQIYTNFSVTINVIFTKEQTEEHLRFVNRWYTAQNVQCDNLQICDQFKKFWEELTDENSFIQHEQWNNEFLRQVDTCDDFVDVFEALNRIEAEEKSDIFEDEQDENFEPLSIQRSRTPVLSERVPLVPVHLVFGLEVIPEDVNY